MIARLAYKYCARLRHLLTFPCVLTHDMVISVPRPCASSGQGGLSLPDVKNNRYPVMISSKQRGAEEDGGVDFLLEVVGTIGEEGGLLSSVHGEEDPSETEKAESQSFGL